MYPRTPLLARLGYLLLLVAALVVCFPVARDLYDQWQIDDTVAVVESESSAASIPLTVGNEPSLVDPASDPTSQQHRAMKPVLAEQGAFPALGNESNHSQATDSLVKDTDSADTTQQIALPERSLPQDPIPELAAKQSGAASVAQQTPRHESMVTPGDFTYLGAFRLPHVNGESSRFAYGGHAITFCPTGDADAADDGFPGSLYMVGHKQHELVAEVSIPKPVVSLDKNMDELTVASVVQPFTDITLGLRDRLTAGSSEPFQFGGMQYLNGRLHWTMFKYYNVTGEDYLSHGLSSADLSSPSVHGMWHLGPRNSGNSVWHSYKHAGYVTDIPQPVADQYFQGRSLMSGLQISTGLQYSSQGPALYAYRPPSGSEPPGSSLDATPLLWYSMDNPIAQHHYADLWTGAAWVTVNGKHAVIIAGRKAHGSVYYGDARPTDCYPDKGYHGSSYEVQMLLYAPAHLLQASKRRVADVQPWARWDSNTEGGGINRFMFQKCGKEVGGLAYDRKHNLLYLSEIDAGFTSDNEWESLPVIHVFRLGDSE